MSQPSHVKPTDFDFKNSCSALCKWSFALVAFACCSLSPLAEAVTPAPDGGYPNRNTAEGEDALFSLTTAFDNTAVGYHALYSDTNLGGNTAIGSNALFSNDGGGNTAVGSAALYWNAFGSLNTALGDSALSANTASNNSATGAYALFYNTSGTPNTANGTYALYNNETGNNNTAHGFQALYSNVNSDNNTAAGYQALYSDTGGSNIALGYQAGFNLTTGSNNIDIGNTGVAGESGAIRVGTKGTHLRTYVAGIYGAPTSGGVPVYINSSGRLGTTTSSARFKQNIHDMGNISDMLLSLRPVIFTYKPDVDPDRVPQFGLVAEEVEKVDPDLVVRDSDGKPYTVRYEAVNAMLLNEFLKQHRKIQEQESTIAQQTEDFARSVGKLETTIAQQEKEIAALAARLKQQEAQIQKVSAQIELSQPSPQTVLNQQ